MKTPIKSYDVRGTVLGAAALASVLLAGCAGAPVVPQGAAEARTKLARLQSDPQLGDRAPAAIKAAEVAVRTAEEPLAKSEAALGAHRVYLADRKVEIAAAMAATKYAEDQRSKLGDERDRARLEARTREADAARMDATEARESATDSANIAKQNAEQARQNAEEMQRQIAALQAEATDRGLVLTLGNVLFATGQSDVKVGATSNLNKLVTFLNQYPDRTAEIEGHTDNVGNDASNQTLSQRRAESVKSYLMKQGVGGQRLVASGKGESDPVSDNDSATGRQQNRRVVVVIDNPAPRPAAASSQ